MSSSFFARLKPRELVLALAALFCVIYVPDVGHGFVKDDFQWISGARQPLASAFTQASDFYRPLVTMSFRLDYELFGLDSYPYGLTNLAIAIACAALVFWLGRSFGLGGGASTFAAAVWAFNFHGINMSVLWVSGRTALLLTIFALLAAVTFLRRSKVLCLVSVSAALLSKEEAVLLPFALLVWQLVLNRDGRTGGRWTSAVADAWWLMIPVPVYAIARLRTEAMTPFNAPEYYTFTFAPLAVARNFVEYIDRSWTYSLVALALVWWFGRPALTIDSKRRTAALCGVVWFLSGLAVTVFLPVRSNLYACWPSAGAALACAAIADGWLGRMTERQLRRAAVAAVLALTALVPVYQVRNERWVEIADLSRDTMAALDRCSAVHCNSILLQDDPRTRRNFITTFGEFDTAARLFLGRDVSTTVVAAPVARAALATDGKCVLHIRLVNDVPAPELNGTCSAAWSDPAGRAVSSTSAPEADRIRARTYDHRLPRTLHDRPEGAAGIS